MSSHETKKVMFRAVPRWRYQTRTPVYTDVGIVGQYLSTEYLILQNDGELVVCGTKTAMGAGYAWDGPSVPLCWLIPTWLHRRLFRRYLIASLVHDAIYQLMRSGDVPIRHRKVADQAYLRVARRDGAGLIVSAIHYYAIRLFGGMFAARKSVLAGDFVAP